MSSWTAEVDWHEDLDELGLVDAWVAALEQDHARVHLDFVTGTVTATVTVEAASLPLAYPLVLARVTRVIDREVSVRRIVATGRYTEGDDIDAFTGVLAD